MKKALILASVASMIDLFNRDNIEILRELGYEIDVAANFKQGSITSQDRVNEYWQELVEKEIKVYHMPIPRNIFKLKAIMKAYKMVKSLVKENNYEIVHCHSPIGGVIARMACRTARRQGTKVIYTAHGFHFFKGAKLIAWIIFYPIEKICSRFTDVLITINKEDFRRALKFHAKCVKYVPGIGVHTGEFRCAMVDKQAKRAEFGIDQEDFVFMSTGQISIRKNQEIIIRALAKIHMPKVKYLIVGFGEMEEWLKKLAKELGIEKNVIFAGYRSDVKELLQVVDAFAFPSLQEGLPVALMEAMASGLPIICSQIRGNTDLIDNGVGGYMYSSDDVDGFATGMKKIIEQSKDNMMKKHNQEKIKKFDVAVVMQEMKRIYQEVSKEN